MASTPAEKNWSAAEEMTAAKLNSLQPQKGLDSEKAASPTAGQSYYATDTKIFYVCFVATNWEIANRDVTTALAAPVGTIHNYAGSTAPTGYLLCDGSAVSRTTYAALYAIIGTTYGTGDGSTTFNVPDLRGKVIAGKSTETEFNALGKTGGEKTHTLTTTEMPSHVHTTESGGGYSGSGAVASEPHQPGYKNTGSAGSDGAHNNLQPYITLNFIIKY